MDTLLLADIGSTFTKVCRIAASDGRLLGRSQAPTTINDDVNRGLDAALDALGRDPGDGDLLACSSAGGGLRIVAIGLIPSLTLEAARQAALGAGGKVVRAFAGRLTRGDLATLEELAPDLILLAGGTDGGDREHILHNAAALAERPALRAPLLFAGNREARDEAMDLLHHRPDVFAVENVMPELGRLAIAGAREAIRNVYLERIVVAKGLDRLRGRAQILHPTPEAVLRALELVHRNGREIFRAAGDLLAVDMGGATTDVYSCAEGAPRQAAVMWRGLPEPFIKRTVEGDVGLRHTAASLIELACPAGGRELEEVTEEALCAWVDAASADPALLPRTPAERSAEAWLTREGVRLAVQRHCGTLETRYTPEGRLLVQEGKDLTATPLLIGSGGAIVRAERPARALAGALRAADEPALKPENPAFWIDREYLLWAVGLLAGRHEKLGLRLAQQTLASCPEGSAA